MQNARPALTTTQSLVYGAFFVALGLLVPKIFHLLGENAGKLFLPMYLPVILAALLLPLKFTVCTAVLTPIVSHLLTGMPPVPLLYFISLDLLVYAITANLLSQKISIYGTVALALLFGKIAYILSILGAAGILGLQLPFANFTMLAATVVLAIPGVLLQLILVPIIYRKLYVGRVFCARA